MFEKLKARWKVNGINLLLIITTFALGGSLCGWAGRKLLLLTGLEKGVAWLVLYILLVTLLWPLCVLVISIPLGQFAFFRKYILKIGRKMIGRKNSGPVSIAIFASGAGSNARQIITSSPALLHPSAGSGEKGVVKTNAKIDWKVALIVCNKPGAGVLKIAEENNIPTLLIEKDRFFNGDCYLPELQKHNISFIVLAGFLWKLPAALIAAYPKKIINIHPALLPKYGGKGMYGNNVHEAVISAGEKESGISIHYVDELYDHGEVIFQAACKVDENDTAESLAQKIHALEHAHYPAVIDSLLKK
ncbi:MAG TPA: phosphoribosylglycinamide formyltransferase [Ferruginibacter sp.]|nr:phosphoribosylglycinamide formyltransferase [Ferruginibacter sp.]